MAKIHDGQEVLSLQNDRSHVQVLIQDHTPAKVWLSIVSAFLIVASVAFALRTIGTVAERHVSLSKAQAADEGQVAPHKGSQIISEQIHRGYLSN